MGKSCDLMYGNRFVRRMRGLINLETAIARVKRASKTKTNGEGSGSSLTRCRLRCDHIDH